MKFQLAALIASSSAASLKMQKLVNMTSVKVGSCSIQPNQDCSGNDLVNFQSSSVDDCCSKCHFDGCGGFTWSKYDMQGQPNPTCYLKSSCSSFNQCDSCVAGSVAPAPAPTPPTPTPPAGAAYCPSGDDFVVSYGSPQLYDQGWSVNGGGAAATKASFNLLGGSVEYDIDLSGVPPGVNANIYSISPEGIGGGFTGGDYCDGADNEQPWCVEVDWLESNGNCGGATTLHTKPGPGNDGCTSWGCRVNYHYNGRASFHMKVEFGADGQWTTKRDGQVISPNSLSPVPGESDWSTLAEQYSSRGAVVYSSQWTGWTPVDDCGGGGDLDSAHFSIKNLRIVGKVVQGPVPRQC